MIAGIGEGAAGRDEITLVQRFDTPGAGLESSSLGRIAHDAAVPIARTGAQQVIIAVISDTAYTSPDELPQRDLVDRWWSPSTTPGSRPVTPSTPTAPPAGHTAASTRAAAHPPEGPSPNP